MNTYQHEVSYTYNCSKMFEMENQKPITTKPEVSRGDIENKETRLTGVERGIT